MTTCSLLAFFLGGREGPLKRTGSMVRRLATHASSWKPRSFQRASLLPTRDEWLMVASF